MTTPQRPSTTRLSWEEFVTCCGTLATKLNQAGRTFDVVLAIMRGGAVAGVIVAHLLDIKSMLCIGVRRTASEGENPQWQDAIVTGVEVLPALAGKKVLLIDDVCNWGETIRAAKAKLLESRPASVTTAAVIWDRGNTATSNVDFHGGETPGWVLLPWEL